MWMRQQTSSLRSLTLTTNLTLTLALALALALTLTPTLPLSLPLPLPLPTPAPAPNQMLFVALHGRHDQAVEVATKAVRRDMAIMCHPDKIRRYDSTKVMATAMMQRLGELASK